MQYESDPTPANDQAAGSPRLPTEEALPAAEGLDNPTDGAQMEAAVPEAPTPLDGSMGLDYDGGGGSPLWPPSPPASSPSNR